MENIEEVEPCKSCNKLKWLKRFCKIRFHEPFSQEDCYKCTIYYALLYYCKKCDSLKELKDDDMSIL